ncbi:ATP-binding protein [Actinotalea solisilvae]|uniref:ATP-binding protein n=1 Tax=Actinotalea solisilvae TaxID=2072922 RepID=UPI0018F1C74A|nr:LuxR family transcriptional regulator [Actinotalea solisilvae]
MADLLERGVLLDALTTALEGAATEGRLALLAGEAGIGKSSVVARFVEQEAGSRRVLLGVCDPLLTPRALGPLHDVARQVGGRLAALLAHGGAREELLAALLDELDRPGPPQVLVVEDVHWADEATLDLLLLLSRRVRHVRALVVVTHRDDELAADHPLRTVLGRLPTDTVVRLHLDPLSPAAVADLARAAGRAEAGLHTLTGGNPLLVTEVLAAGDADVPLTVRDLVLARVAGLPPEAQDALRVVAVVPTRAETWLVEAVLGPSAGAVDDAVAAGLLVSTPDAVGFRHELLRRAVEGATSGVVRRELNRRVLDALTSTDRPVDVARLVHHAREADDVAATVRHAPEAARQAAAVGAHREAVGHHRVALLHADRFTPHDRADLLEACSVECYLAGFSSEAVAARRAAVLLREQLAEPERVGSGLRWLSRLHWWDGDRAAAEAAAARAVDVLEAVGPGHELAMAYSNRAQLEMLAHHLAPAVEWAGRAVALAEQLDDRQTLSHALTNIGSARLQGEDPTGRADLERGFEIAAAAGLEDDAARALCNLATIPAEHRDYAAAAEDLERALRYARERELGGYVQHLLGHRARLRLDLGDWTGAERDARAALTERASGGARVVDALVPLGLLQARRGDPDADATLDEAAARGFATAELQWTVPVAAARAEHAWLAGDHPRAAAEVARVYDRAVAAAHPWFVGELALWLWAAGALPAVPRTAAPPYHLLVTGRWREAADAFGALGFTYHRALALAWSGDDDARLAALPLLDGLGAHRTAQRVRRDLRRDGLGAVPRGPIRATAAHAAGLTPRQAEVLTLLAQGLTDAEVATRLSLSAKTVGHHVSALLAKLGVASRRDAAAAARRLGVALDLPDRPLPRAAPGRQEMGNAVP